MRYQQLLLAVDLQHEASHLIQRAAKLAHRMNAELTLLSVIPVADEKAVTESELWHLKRHSLDYLTRITSALPCHIRRYQVEAGEVMEQIHFALRELQPDLLILGHRQANGLLGHWRTSLAERLPPSTRYDVLILDDDSPFWSAPLHFTLALTLHPSGQTRLHRAATFANWLEAALTVIHVLEPVAEAQLAIELEQESQHWLESRKSRAEHQLADWMAHLAGPLPRWEVLSGDAASLLSQHMKQSRDALLIVGSEDQEDEHWTSGYHLHALLQHKGDVLVMR